MYKGLRICVVVPAYNEARLIAQTVRGVPEFVDHVVVVDDRSSDETATIVEGLVDGRVQLIRHERNTGVGGAIVDGHRAALALGADVSVVMAGDDQMDPDQLPALLDPIADDGVGFTKANRFYARSSFAGMPRHRVFGNVVLSFLTKASSGYWQLFDPQNGYTALSRSALERLELDRIAAGYSFENDLLIELNILGIRARDVPIPARYGDERSTMRLRRVAPRLMWLLFMGFWRRMIFKYVLWSFSAIALLFFTGLGLIAIGLAFGVFATIETIGPPTASAGTVLLAVAPTLTGIYLLVQALVLDIQASPD